MDLAFDKSVVFAKPSIWGPASVALLLLVVALVGGLPAAWGYGLFLVAGVLLITGVVLFGVFTLSHAGGTEALKGAFIWLFVMGAWAYLFAVCALAGHYAFETVQGRMELRWILFGPAVLAALIVLDYGIYRVLVGKNLPTWERFKQYVSRERSDPAAMRRTLVDDVVLHKSLYSVSGFRWLRHTLIFWGFMLMFFLELLAVAVREALPAFGMRDIWEQHDHPLRLAFDFGFETFGLMVLIGCIMALVWRAMVNGTEEQKYSDTPTALFLLFVVVSGFIVEGMRIAGMSGLPLQGLSYVGYIVAGLFPTGDWVDSAGYELLWIVHVLGSCLFIAYVPARRLIHSCATPMGRLMHSQKGMLAAKKEAVLRGLMTRRLRTNDKGLNQKTEN
ncbi:MAG: hypothetical protein ACR2RB_05435 [Gammaproteobacteria bacterium]